MEVTEDLTLNSLRINPSTDNANIAALDVEGPVTMTKTLSVTGASTLTGATTVASAITANDFVNVASGKGFAVGAAGVSGLTAVALTANTTLASNNHSVQKGKYVSVTGDGKVLTLPAVVIGASFIIVNNNEDGEGLLTISPHTDDQFLVNTAGAEGTDNKDISNTKATQKKGDYVKLVGLHADGWLIDDIRGTWATEA